CGNSQDSGGMTQDTTDIMASHLRETSVAFAIIEERLLVFPQARMRVHTRTIVAEDGLGHEGDGLTIFACRVLDNVLVEQHTVGGFHQGIEADVDFSLTCSTNFMMMCLDGNTQF